MTGKAGIADRGFEAPMVAHDRLLKTAVQAAHNAYAPYSGFHVGAALLTESGGLHAGANVENVSYPVGSCAETAALAAARTAEGGTLQIIAVLIYAENGGVQQPCAPCGACRQRLVEFNPDMAVTFHAGEQGWITVPARQLLPFAFSF